MIFVAFSTAMSAPHPPEAPPDAKFGFPPPLPPSSASTSLRILTQSMSMSDPQAIVSEYRSMPEPIMQMHFSLTAKLT